jgi:aconitase A
MLSRQTVGQGVSQRALGNRKTFGGMSPYFGCLANFYVQDNWSKNWAKKSVNEKTFPPHYFSIA